MLDKTFAFLEWALAGGVEGRLTISAAEMLRSAEAEVKLLRSLPEIVFLVGSSRFKIAFEREQERLELQGCIVIGKHVFKPGNEWPYPEITRDMLHAVQFRKADLCNRVYVVNVDGYIGKDTYNVIRYALRVGKPVGFVEPEVQLMHRGAVQGERVTKHHFLQATQRRVEFDEATVG